MTIRIRREVMNRFTPTLPADARPMREQDCIAPTLGKSYRPRMPGRRKHGANYWWLTITAQPNRVFSEHVGIPPPTLRSPMTTQEPVHRSAPEVQTSAGQVSPRNLLWQKMFVQYLPTRAL